MESRARRGPLFGTWVNIFVYPFLTLANGMNDIFRIYENSTCCLDGSWMLRVPKWAALKETFCQVKKTIPWKVQLPVSPWKPEYKGAVCLESYVYFILFFKKTIKNNPLRCDILFLQAHSGCQAEPDFIFLENRVCPSVGSTFQHVIFNQFYAQMGYSPKKIFRKRGNCFKKEYEAWSHGKPVRAESLLLRPPPSGGRTYWDIYTKQVSPILLTGGPRGVVCWIGHSSPFLWNCACLGDVLLEPRSKALLVSCPLWYVFNSLFNMAAGCTCLPQDQIFRPGENLLHEIYWETLDYGSPFHL